MKRAGWWRLREPAAGLWENCTVCLKCDRKKQLSEDESLRPVTVIYKGSISQERVPAVSLGKARKIALDLVGRYGPEAWRNLIVQDAQGEEHRPSELWGELS
jgi:hypothetical protein